MANRVKWNVSAGKHIPGEGWQFNRDYRTQSDARTMAGLLYAKHPDWGRPTIRKMELIPDFLPGFGACWYERKQEPWPKEEG